MFLDVFCAKLHLLLLFDNENLTKRIFLMMNGK
jgi:hypothetical protein